MRSWPLAAAGRTRVVRDRIDEQTSLVRFVRWSQ